MKKKKDLKKLAIAAFLLASSLPASSQAKEEGEGSGTVLSANCGASRSGCGAATNGCGATYPSSNPYETGTYYRAPTYNPNYSPSGYPTSYNRPESYNSTTGTYSTPPSGYTTPGTSSEYPTSSPSYYQENYPSQRSSYAPSQQPSSWDTMKRR